MPSDRPPYPAGIRVLFSWFSPASRTFPQFARSPALLAFLMCVASSCFSVINVYGGMIIDPSLGTVIAGGNSPGGLDFAVQLTFDAPFQGRFFGVGMTNVYAADNGNLNFEESVNGDTNFFSNADNLVARISPFWDDFYFVAGLPNRVTAFHSPGTFIVVSWLQAHLSLDELAGGVFPATNRSAQVLWMESDASIRGFDFKRDDIAFSYIGHVAGSPDFGPEVYARVALDDGSGASGKTAVLPGSDNGYIEAGDAGLLPWQDDEFLLFRWNAGLANYEVSIESFTAVPEPTSLVLVVSIAVVGWARGAPCRFLKKRANKT